METASIFKAKVAELINAPWQRKVWVSLSLVGLSFYFLLTLLVIQFLRLLSTSCFFCH